jgi:hypothetical protein
MAELVICRQAQVVQAAQADKVRGRGVLKGLQIQRNPELRELPATRVMLAERGSLAQFCRNITQRTLSWLTQIP